jgi:peptidoglycan-associated lipoprotein
MRWFVVLSLLFAVGCRKHLPEVPIAPPMAVQPKVAPEEVARQDAIAELKANFQRVHFDYDSDRLDASSKTVLSANAAILQKYTDIEVEIEGHTDERGTTEYNLALGERRAEAVRTYLRNEGVSASRLRAMSYGEERPLVAGHNESVWAENRRAEFRVIAATRGASL